MAAVRHIGFVLRDFWTSREEYSVVCHFEKFGWIRCSSFDNMQVLIFCTFGFKMFIHEPFLVFDAFGPLSGK